MLALTTSFVEVAKNEEIRLESMRVLSNLSRSGDLHSDFYKIKLHERIGRLMDESSRDMQYYMIGVVINLSRSEILR